MPLRFFYFVFLLLATLLVQACGFQLRGALDISPAMSPVYLQQNSVFELGREIKALLATNKIALTDNLAQAKSQLVLLKEAKQSRVLSVDGSGRAREYTLTYTVDFIISIQPSENLAATQKQNSISLSRNMLFDADAVLAVSNEMDVLYKDMRHQAARLILLKLQARSRQSSMTDSKTVIDSPETDTAQ